MSRKVALVLMLGLSRFCFGQQYDANWVIGGYTGMNALEITADSVKLDTLPGRVGIYEASACISDENGNLLYYTNGAYINDKNSNLLQNGDSLSPCAYTRQQYNDGLGSNQSCLFLPKPADSSTYYLFHMSWDTIFTIGPYTYEKTKTLYYSIINKNGNGGLGTVTQKNIKLLKHVVLRGDGMTACKHANGRDYWIVVGESNTNGFYKFLVTPDSILGPFVQYIGPAFPRTMDYVAYSKFSQDGSKYATGIGGYAPLLIMDFDRCYGEFSNPDTIFNNTSTNPIADPISGIASVEFSPSGRFVYVSGVRSLNQYDLWSANIQDSVAVYTADSNEFYQINAVQLAQNGKLYACTWNGGLPALHVVNYPDLKGDSCDFVYGGQSMLVAEANNLPNLINYKLGPLIGSSCDTLRTACNSTDTAINASICNGENYYVGSFTHNQTGNYTDTLQTLSGCDSIVNLQLTVLPLSTDSLVASICKGQIYSVGTFVHNQTGIYSDTLQTLSGCDSIVSLQLTVDTITTQLLQPVPDTLVVMGNGSISWLDCNSNQLIVGAVADTFVPKTSGTYASIVTHGNCADTSECVTVIVNGIREIGNSDVRIYPNPTINTLHITLNQTLPHTLQLYDMRGALLATWHFTGASEQVDLSAFSNGVYFIAIEAQSGSVREKVVKME